MCCQDGWTALHRASVNGYQEIVKLLLSHHCIDVNKDGNVREPSYCFDYSLFW